MLNVIAIKQALADMEKKASKAQETKPVTEQIDELVTELSSVMDDGVEREQLQKLAYLDRREKVAIAKVLAGIDALTHQGRDDG